MGESFYEQIDQHRFRSSPWTTGPWDPGAQHGGPPGALLARSMEQCRARPEMMVARVTVEILRPVPVADLEVSVEVVRPGRSVEMLAAVLSSGGVDVARASAWRVLRTRSESVPDRHPQAPPLPSGGSFDPPQGWVDGYLSAIDWRVARGGFAEPGPSAMWTRMRLGLVGDEEPSSLQRVMVVADSGSGVSGELDLRRWLFINPELTVHLHRESTGEWVCLDAATSVTAGGVGLATSILSDLSGPIGVGAQALLVAERGT